MLRPHKALVDHFQSFMSFRLGRAVSQVETMHIILVLAFSNRDHPLLAGFGGVPPSWGAFGGHDVQEPGGASPAA
jgi:hypothetical protein